MSVYEFAENETYPDVNRLQPRVMTAEVHNLAEGFGFRENIYGAIILKLFSCTRSQFKISLNRIAPM